MNTGLLLERFFLEPCRIPLSCPCENTAHRMHVFYTTSLLLNWDMENEVIVSKAWKKKKKRPQAKHFALQINWSQQQNIKNWAAAGGRAWQVCLRRGEWTVCLWTRYMTRGQKAPHQYGRRNTCACQERTVIWGDQWEGRRKGTSKCLYWPGRAARWNRNRWKCELSIRGGGGRFDLRTLSTPRLCHLHWKMISASLLELSASLGLMGRDKLWRDVGGYVWIDSYTSQISQRRHKCMQSGRQRTSGAVSPPPTHTRAYANTHKSF